MSTTDTTPGADLAIVSQGLLNQFAAMVVGIPEADDSEAYEAIVTQLLNADGVDALNAPWNSDAAEHLNGHRLRIESITRRPSDYSEGLGQFLVCKGIDMGTGEPFVLSTGSVSIVAQLVRAHYLKAFPVIAELVIADKPTKKGYRPQHLNVIAFGGSK